MRPEEEAETHRTLLVQDTANGALLPTSSNSTLAWVMGQFSAQAGAGAQLLYQV